MNHKKKQSKENLRLCPCGLSATLSPTVAYKSEFVSNWFGSDIGISGKLRCGTFNDLNWYFDWKIKRNEFRNFVINLIAINIESLILKPFRIGDIIVWYFCIWITTNWNDVVTIYKIFVGIFYFNHTLQAEQFITGTMKMNRIENKEMIITKWEKNIKIWNNVNTFIGFGLNEN